jgi:hypothetical protein
VARLSRENARDADFPQQPRGKQIF